MSEITNDNTAPEQRAAKERPKGKGYRMGNKLQVTVLFAPNIVDQLDVIAVKFGEARTVVINRAVREFLARVGPL